MIWLLLLAAAQAGTIRLAATPGVDAEVLPAIMPGRIDLLFRPTPAALTAGRISPSPDIRAMRVTNLGGSAVLTLWPLDPSARATVSARGREWVIEVGGSGAPTDGGALPPVDAAQTDPGCGNAPRSPLVPLHGMDSLQWLPAAAFVPELPSWEAGEPATASWEQVAADRLRFSALLAGAPTTSPDERQRLAYGLGAQHRQLQFQREAAYYFGVAHEAGAPQGLALLQRAGAQLAVEDFAAAEATAVTASSAGAPAAPTLTILATADLLSGKAPRASVGMVLARLDAGPKADLAAGAVLLRAGCFAGAVRPLQRAIAVDDPLSRGVALLLLFEAQLLSGKGDLAEDALALFDPRAAPSLRGVFESRAMLMGLIRVSPSQWAEFLPQLHGSARQEGPLAAEALFLLGQIGEAYNEPTLALASYAELVDRWRPFARGEPGARLAAIWQRRVAAQVARGDDVAAVITHATYWRSSLLQVLPEPEPLIVAAGAHSRLGLYSPSLSLLAEAGRMLRDLGRDDRDLILRIAQTYAHLTQYEEMEDTLAFLGQRPADPRILAESQLLRARVLETKGATEAARQVYAGVKGDEAAVQEAARRMGLIDARAGRCERALALLPAEPAPDGEPPAGILLAARAGCLERLGPAAAARGEALRAAEVLQDPGTADVMRYLARSGPPEEQGDTPQAQGGAAEGHDGVWARLARADARWAGLLARIPKSGSSASANDR